MPMMKWFGRKFKWKLIIIEGNLKDIICRIQKWISCDLFGWTDLCVLAINCPPPLWIKSDYGKWSGIDWNTRPRPSTISSSLKMTMRSWGTMRRKSGFWLMPQTRDELWSCQRAVMRILKSSGRNIRGEVVDPEFLNFCFLRNVFKLRNYNYIIIHRYILYIYLSCLPWDYFLLKSQYNINKMFLPCRVNFSHILYSLSIYYWTLDV